MRLTHSPLVAGVLAIALTLALASIAFAHAEYVSSVPAANSTVATEPATVKTIHSEAINPKGSSLTVVGPNGQKADLGDGHVDLTDPNRVTMIVSLKPGLGNGTYTVKWDTVSAVDGDEASGTFTFNVGAPSAAAAAAGLPKTGGVPLELPVAVGLGAVFVGAITRRIAH